MFPSLSEMLEKARHQAETSLQQLKEESYFVSAQKMYSSLNDDTNVRQNMFSGPLLSCGQ